MAAALLAVLLVPACTTGSPRGGTTTSPTTSSGDSSGPADASTAPTIAPSGRNVLPAPPTPGVPSADRTRLPAVPASCRLAGAVLGRQLTGIPTTERVAALAFTVTGDDVGLSRILATLTATGAPATFFLSGTFAQSFPDSAAAIAVSHPIGNATQDGFDLTTLSNAAIATEITRGAVSIRAATGQDPLPVLQEPLGAGDARTTAVLNAACQVALRWTVDSQGWRGRVAGTTASLRDRVMSGLVPGAVVALTVGSQPEDGSTLDADALDAVIAAIRSRGYDLVTLERLVTPTS